MTKSATFSKEESKAVLAWMNSHLPEIQEVSDNFYLQYGKTLAAWSLVETELGAFFERITKMREEISSKVFYSARSFNGRADMFEAALSVSKLSPEMIAFLRAVLKKARIYSGFRNRLAHGEFAVVPIFNGDEEPSWRMVIKEGSDDSEIAYDDAVTVDGLAFADKSFRLLAGHIMAAYHGRYRRSLLEKRRQQVLQLPNLKRSKSGLPKASKSKGRPRSSQV